jgi:hypothetical protein
MAGLKKQIKKSKIVATEKARLLPRKARLLRQKKSKIVAKRGKNLATGKK